MGVTPRTDATRKASATVLSCVDAKRLRSKVGSVARAPPSSEDASERRESRADRVERGTVRGVQGGLVATAIMTAFRLPIMRSLPPTANVWAKYVSGGEPEDHPVVGLLLHLLYGTVGGATFGAAFGLLGENRAIEPEQRGILWGVAYGLGLSAIGSQVVLPKLVGARPDADELALFHAAHLVYGVALGAWVGSRTEGTDDPVDEYDYEDEHPGRVRSAL